MNPGISLHRDVRSFRVAVMYPCDCFLGGPESISLLLLLLPKDHHLPAIAAGVITFRIRSAAEQLCEDLLIFRIHPVFRPTFLKVQIHIPAVHGSHACSVFRTLHPAFDLERNDPCIDQIRQYLQRTDILRAEKILFTFPAQKSACSVRFISQITFIQFIRKPARLCAPAPVAAPSADQAAHQALA